ncbi:MAG: septal ring lytic transglycosylase RlpA family lipoprotein [Martelella sp.]|uniref:septal ring lytic transglycosylase RlpA family protein n=1 Tax=unclassified Martelella TaxID=2629616 RepID=UPI000C358A25|nr:septal ring lytic transglycosylase RlpA family protein [Martelella sp.]MAU21924.1 septal ring lytic transglycosylase RlpA family lipoprotein [Martelella sp.]|tara:strand:- start:1395 stop:2261 length:867 start_codon:yes stop_codon:yes gene_type:complete
MKEIRFSTSLAMLAMTALMASCTTTGDTSKDIKDDAAEVADAAKNSISEADALSYQKIGKPYQVRGKWYTPKADTKYSKTGLASWYGPKFNGAQTASGEIYDMNHLSAAHKTLPLPSYVRVTNLDNDSSVIVRVNDRGPFVSGRIIDLSKKAAEMLDVTGSGVANVKVDYVGPASRNADDMNYLMASYEKKEVPEGVDPGRFGEVQLAKAEAPAAVATVETTETVVATTETSEKPVELATASVKPEEASAQLALVEEAKPVAANDASEATETILADNTSYPVPIPFKR